MSIIPFFPRTPEALPAADDISPALADARQVAARPDLYSRQVILDACDVLADRGDWLDMRRGDDLRAAIRREMQWSFAAAEEPPVALPWWAWTIAGAVALALGILAAEALIQLADAATTRQIAAGAREW